MRGDRVKIATLLLAYRFVLLCATSIAVAMAGTTAVLIAVGYRHWPLRHTLSGLRVVNLSSHALIIPCSQIVCFVLSFAGSWPAGFERPQAVCALPQCSQSERADRAGESVESSPKLRCQLAAR